MFSGNGSDHKVIALAVPLKIKALDENVLFVTTHLKSKKTQNGEEIREKQIRALLGDGGLVQNEGNFPVIVCCDLNRC